MFVFLFALNFVLINNVKFEQLISNYKKRISDNKLIGVLPPGYISNGKLCEKNNETGKYVLKSNVKFKEDYISYSQALDETIATSCKTDPDKFYRELEKTRIARKKLNEDYKKTNEILNQHKTKVKELMESL